MAEIKNFSLAGVSSTVQFGKRGPKLVQANDAFSFKTAADDALTNVSVAEPTYSTHAATKSYVDSVLTGMDQSHIVSTDGTVKVDTEGTPGKVTVAASNGTANTLVATFQSGSSANSNVLVDNSFAGKILFQAASDSASDVNVHIAPKGAGELLVGAAGSDGVIQADDGMSLTIAGGDNLAGTGGNLLIRAGSGTTSDGTVRVVNSQAHSIADFVGGSSSATTLVVTAGATDVSIESAGSSPNVDIVISPKGAGVVNVSTSLVSNVLDPIADQDAATKNYVDVTSKVGSIQTREITLSTATNTVGLPIKGKVRRVMLKITQAYNNGAQITVGTDATPDLLVSSNDIDESTVGQYDLNNSTDFASSTQLKVFVTGGPSTGAATLVVEYIQG